MKKNHRRKSKQGGREVKKEEDHPSSSSSYRVLRVSGQTARRPSYLEGNLKLQNLSTGSNFEKGEAGSDAGWNEFSRLANMPRALVTRKSEIIRIFRYVADDSRP